MIDLNKFGRERDVDGYDDVHRTNNNAFLWDGGAGEDLKDNSITSNNITCLFKNLKENLINEINKAELVVGCVAWLTDPEILNAMSKKETCIIVQKEDFLRPDVDMNKSSSKQYYKKMYDKLKCSLDRAELIGFYSCCGDPTMQPVRCCGITSENKKMILPRMHNKFLIFCKVILNAKHTPDEWGYHMVVPYKVWTGSFNFSKNASLSFENAITIKDEKIVNAYYNEFSNIAALSEPLDWSSEYMEPEWRIGT